MVSGVLNMSMNLHIVHLFNDNLKYGYKHKYKHRMIKMVQLCHQIADPDLPSVLTVS